jgi:hypothetical protein
MSSLPFGRSLYNELNPTNGMNLPKFDIKIPGIDIFQSLETVPGASSKSKE